MSKDIRISKGLNIRLKGESDKITKKVDAASLYVLNMSDYHGITPKLVLKVGDKVKAGEPIFYSKTQEKLKFVSPVSGEIVEIVRGAKRRILQIAVLAESERNFLTHNVENYSQWNLEELKDFLLESGAWVFIKQRPYDVIANTEVLPRDIYISAYDSSPLAPDFDYTLKGKEKELQAAIDVLKRFTSGKVHLSLHHKSTVSPFNSINNIEKHKLFGNHPIGNVSTQINKTQPLNKGEVIWTVNPSDLVIIGELLLTGKMNMEKTIALSGYQVEKPHYKKVIVGAPIATIVKSELKEGNNRIIDGSIFTGKKVTEGDFMSIYSNQIVVIDEGDDYDLFGWVYPRPNKFSVLRASMLSFLTPNKRYKLNANTNGEHRAFVLNSTFDKVFPLDIYPIHLIKSCLYQDIDEMEKLGIYEVAPEDFALTEFVDPSKGNHQEIIRKGLDLMIQEVG